MSKTFDRKKLQKLLETAYRTVLILKEIEAGERDQTAIANKIKAPRQLVNYYFRAVGVPKE